MVENESPQLPPQDEIEAMYPLLAELGPEDWHDIAEHDLTRHCVAFTVNEEQNDVRKERHS